MYVSKNKQKYRRISPVTGSRGSSGGGEERGLETLYKDPAVAATTS